MVDVDFVFASRSALGSVHGRGFYFVRGSCYRVARSRCLASSCLSKSVTVVVRLLHSGIGLSACLRSANLFCFRRLVRGQHSQFIFVELRYDPFFFLLRWNCSSGGAIAASGGRRFFPVSGFLVIALKTKSMSRNASGRKLGNKGFL